MSHKHITKAQSRVLVLAYKEHKGRWNDVMDDAAVQATGLPRHQVERHINYKKSRGRKKAGRVDEPDTEEQQQQQRRTDTGVKAETRGDDSPNSLLSISSDDEEERQAAVKREAGDDLLADASAKRPRLHPESLDDGGGDSLDIELDHALAQSVSSTSVRSAEDMQRVARDVRARNRQQAQQSQSRKKQSQQQQPPPHVTPEEDELYEVPQVKKERPTQRTTQQRQQQADMAESQTTVQITMQMMALQMMQRMMRDIDRDAADDDEAEDADNSKLAQLRADVLALQQESAALKGQLAALRTSVDTLLGAASQQQS